MAPLTLTLNVKQSFSHSHTPQLWILCMVPITAWYLFFREGNALLIDFRVKTKVPSLPYKGLWSWIDPSSLSILSTSSRPDVSTSCPCSYALFILSLLFRDSYLLPHPYLLSLPGEPVSGKLDKGLFSLSKVLCFCLVCRFTLSHVKSTCWWLIFPCLWIIWHWKNALKNPSGHWKVWCNCFCTFSLLAHTLRTLPWFCFVFFLK